MARICMKSSKFKEEVIEVIGYKSGMILDEVEIAKYLNGDSLKLWESTTSNVCFRSEDYEEIIYSILNSIGSSKSQNPYLDMFKHYNKSNKDMTIFENIIKLRNNWLKEEIKRCTELGGKSIDPSIFLKQSYDKYGKLGYKYAYEMISSLIEYQKSNPYSSVRRIEWNDSIQLKDLFKSEGLEASYGTFIDQRYIDYLYKNFDNDIDLIHWRKFEALTCEYFQRQGYHVEIGKGRNDGGIDAKVWRLGEYKTSPTIIIQCKRQKNKVSNTIVKALYADIEEENAESGLIVTSTEISPSGKKTATARGYKIDWCERDKLKLWIENMRSK